MVPFPALNDQLDTLTAALDDPGTDLHAILDVLVDDLSAAVSSFLGLTMTLQTEWCPVTLIAVDPDLALSAGASLALPLRPSAGATMVLYAGQHGAFVDLAADLDRVPGPGGWVVLDGDLPDMSAPQQRPGISGLAELGVVNRAIGVLVTRGHTPAKARAGLRRRAAVGLTSVTEVARHVLDSTNAPPRRPENHLPGVGDRLNATCPHAARGVVGRTDAPRGSDDQAPCSHHSTDMEVP